MMVVVPRGVLPRALFLASAIALALAQWAQGATAAEVRREVSPQRTLGTTAVAGWASLRRWARSARYFWSRLPLVAANMSLRDQARQVVAFLASHALVARGDAVADAMEGAGRAR